MDGPSERAGLIGLGSPYFTTTVVPTGTRL